MSHLTTFLETYEADISCFQEIRPELIDGGIFRGVEVRVQDGTI